MTSPEKESEFLAHEPCNNCGSSDAGSRYSDGHLYCHKCQHFEPGEGQGSGGDRTGGDLRSNASGGSADRRFQPIDVTISAIPKRGLSERTCALWGYGTGTTSGGEPCHVAQYREPSNGSLAAQKLRTASKDFPWLKPKGLKAPLYGQWLWKGDRRSLIITEGELDALSVSQAQDNKYPVVSVPNGAQGAVNDIRRHYEWVCEFDKIVLMFDMDEPGQAAAVEVAEMLPPGKVFIADLGDYKDANEALVDGKPSAIISAFFNAKPYQPDGIFTLSDIRAEVLKPVEMGRPWFLPSLTQWTFGRRDGEVYYFGAGTGVGKTDWFTQQIAFDVLELNIKTAVIYLEQPPAETGKRIAGKVAGRSFHVPDGSWTQEELLETFDRIEATGNLLLGGNFSAANWERIASRIRFLAQACGVKHIFLDHLTALADPSNERESLEKITKELALLAQELKIVIHVISHLSTPDGKPHEEGGRVMLRHFKGSRAIGFWAHYAFGLERNPQAEDPAEAQLTTFRCLKDRYTGRANGKILALEYDPSTGLIGEGSFPSTTSGFDEVADLEV